MKRVFHLPLALAGATTAVFAACYVNGPARQCYATVPVNGMICINTGGVIPWISKAPPGASGRTQACVTGPHCRYDCPSGQTFYFYTGAVVGGCGDPCVGSYSN